MYKKQRQTFLESKNRPDIEIQALELKKYGKMLVYGMRKELVTTGLQILQEIIDEGGSTNYNLKFIRTIGLFRLGKLSEAGNQAKRLCVLTNLFTETQLKILNSIISTQSNFLCLKNKERFHEE
ncbi:hypothetical protein MXB_5161 [Myxobolus squamalis]|nr:hypothetical protein MXB_5161 [Myxobolus squamalis]